MELDD